MAQGIRTINGYTNNYPTATSASSTLTWNTEYTLGSISSLSCTIPSYAVADGAREIRIKFTASSTFTASITTSNFTTTYGLSDLSITGGKSYELSFVPLSASVLTCVVKEWG